MSAHMLDDMNISGHEISDKKPAATEKKPTTKRRSQVKWTIDNTNSNPNTVRWIPVKYFTNGVWDREKFLHSKKEDTLQKERLLNDEKHKIDLTNKRREVENEAFARGVNVIHESPTAVMPHQLPPVPSPADLKGDDKTMDEKVQELEEERNEMHDTVDKLVIVWNLEHNAKKYHDKVDAHVDKEKEFIISRYS